MALYSILVLNKFLCAAVVSPVPRTERHGRVVNTPTSYSGGPGLESRPRRPAILIEGFRGFPQSLQDIVGIVP
jgi:hypothetical protein